MAIGDINLLQPVQRPEIWLCKPNRDIIAKITQKSAIGFSRWGKRTKLLKHTQLIKLGSINEMSFSVPFEIEIGHELVRNPAVDLFKDRYLLKVILNNTEEWYIITNIINAMDGAKNVKTIQAKSLGHELIDRTVRSFKVVSGNLSSLVSTGGTTVDANGNSVPYNSLLYGTLWSLDPAYDVTFDTMYRTFDIPKASALDALVQVCKTFGCVMIFNTINRTINFKQLNNIGQDKGFKISYRNYMKSLENESKGDEVCTRFYPYGKNNLTINASNPSGLPFIDDFSYFLYPFSRDINKVVLQHSNYMSDGLCNAILDYQTLLNNNSFTFSNLLSTLKGYQTTLTSQKNTLTSDKTALAVTQGNLDKAQTTGQPTSTLLSQQSTQQAQVNTDQANIDTTNAQIASLTLTITVTAAATASGNIQFTIDGKNVVVALTSGDTTNTVASKINTQFNTLYPAYKSTVTNNVVTVTYYTSESYQSAIATFSDVGTTHAVATISIGVDYGVQNQISTLQTTLNINSNFTASQQSELLQFVKEKDWQDNKISDPLDLYNQALIQFPKYSAAQTIVKIDIINLLEMVSQSRNWDKLSIGDTIGIQYDTIGTNVKAKLVEISFDHNEGNITLTIANIDDLKRDEEKIYNMIYQGIGANSALSVNTDRWNNIDSASANINNLYNNGIAAGTIAVNSGVGSTTKIDGRGFTSTNSVANTDFIRINNGAMIISPDGGQTTNIAINKTGIFANVLVGQQIFSSTLTCTNTAGTFSVNGTGVTIAGASLTITAGLPESQINSTSTSTWNTASTKAGNSVQLGTSYNNVIISAANGINVIDSLVKSKTIMDANGFKIQKNTGTSGAPTWTNTFSADANGNLTVSGIIDASDFRVNGVSRLNSTGELSGLNIIGTTLTTSTNNNRMVLTDDGLFSMGSVYVYPPAWVSGKDGISIENTAGNKRITYAGTYWELTQTGINGLGGASFNVGKSGTQINANGNWSFPSSGIVQFDSNPSFTGTPTFGNIGGADVRFKGYLHCGNFRPDETVSSTFSIGSGTSILNASGDWNFQSNNLVLTYSSTASAGTATLPSNPYGFYIVSINGVQRKIPVYV